MTRCLALRVPSLQSLTSRSLLKLAGAHTVSRQIFSVTLIAFGCDKWGSLFTASEKSPWGFLVAECVNSRPDPYVFFFYNKAGNGY